MENTELVGKHNIIDIMWKIEKSLCFSVSETPSATSSWCVVAVRFINDCLSCQKSFTETVCKVFSEYEGKCFIWLFGRL